MGAPLFVTNDHINVMAATQAVNGIMTLSAPLDHAYTVWLGTPAAWRTSACCRVKRRTQVFGDVILWSNCQCSRPRCFEIPTVCARVAAVTQSIHKQSYRLQRPASHNYPSHNCTIRYHHPRACSICTQAWPQSLNRRDGGRPKCAH